MRNIVERSPDYPAPLYDNLHHLAAENQAAYAYADGSREPKSAMPRNIIAQPLESWQRTSSGR